MCVRRSFRPLTDKAANLVTRPCDVNAGAHQKRLWPLWPEPCVDRDLSSGERRPAEGGCLSAVELPCEGGRAALSQDGNLEHRGRRKSTRREASLRGWKRARKPVGRISDVSWISGVAGRVPCRPGCSPVPCVSRIVGVAYGNARWFTPFAANSEHCPDNGQAQDVHAEKNGKMP